LEKHYLADSESALSALVSLARHHFSP
jgi:hypothetical protein